MCRGVILRVILGLWLSLGLAGAQTLRVFAASSLTDAFTDVVGAFEAEHPGSEVALNFAGSALLAAQLEQGAPADVFASADEATLERLVAGGLVDADSAEVFARNELALLTTTTSPIKTLADLREPHLLVLAAPAVPAGRYALELLNRLAERYGPEYPQAVLANVVSLEANVRQVAAKIALGEADAAIVYTTDAQALIGAAPVRTVPIPAADNVAALYPVGVLATSSEPALARSFTAYLLSEQGQAVLARYGFASPP